MKEFSSRLLAEVDDQLNFIRLETDDSLRRAERSIVISQASLHKLKSCVIKHRFKSQADEIRFFKQTKPCRGTILMVDPLLGGFDMPVMIDLPIAAKDVSRLDVILVTHADNDHYSVPTTRDLKSVTRAYHSAPILSKNQ